MPSTPSFRIRCQFCSALLLVRDDQIGRRIKCNKCHYAFLAVAPSQENESDDSNDVAPATAAEDAKEIIFVAPPAQSRTWNRAKIASRFERAPDLVFDACTQAIRGCNCDVLDVDRVSLKIRFAFGLAGQGCEHSCTLFNSGDNSCELEIVSLGPNTENQFDPYYETIVREVNKYLMFAKSPVHEPQVTQQLVEIHQEPRRSRAISRWEEDDYDDYEPRRYRRNDNSGLAIAGFVCGLVGLVLFCFPIFAIILGILGIVFGVSGRGSRQNGLAVAGLICGILAVASGFILLVVLFRHPNAFY